MTEATGRAADRSATAAAAHAARGPARAALAWWPVLLPAGLFLVVRLFSGHDVLPVGGDQCKYLTLGRTFPLHRVGDALFLLHPPAFGYTIGLLATALPLLAAGLVATLAWACANVVAVAALGRALGLAPAGLAAGLLFLALDRASVAYDTHVSRVSIMVCSVALALLAYERWREAPTGRRAGWVIASSAFAHLVSDQSLSLLLCQVVICAVHLDRRTLPRAAGLLAATAATFLVWPAVRLWVYAHHPDYPAGLDGTIEFTRPITWQALLQPHYLPFTRAHAGLYMNVAPGLGDYDVRVLLERPLDLLLVPRALAGALAAGLCGAALLAPGRRRLALKLALLSVVLLLPASVGLNEWHGMGFVVPFSLLLSVGAGTVVERVRGARGWWPAVVGGVSVLLGARWVSQERPAPLDLFRPAGGSHLLFAREPVTRAARVAALLSGLPPDAGVMAPVGLTPELAYLTGRRVVALPFDPALVERFAQEYGIARIVLSDEGMRRFEDPVADRFTGAEATRYVLEHPERFEPVATLEERYPGYYPPTTFVVLKAFPRR